ncbi:MAG: hypothetical protein OSP8Acid_15100 [uncultured Acidilobus sp. OSP8]|nr:MAG: hypothetical protein OSP8Acid_15100 [uncultured Acidilobus sp. OSP8]
MTTKAPENSRGEVRKKGCLLALGLS